MSPDDRRPIGLLGGSFDPIHVGHVQFARDALRGLALARVLFVPAGQAWQKGPAADGAHRARMIQLATGDEPRFVLDRRELERSGPSYTVDTLLELRHELGPGRPLVLLIGADQFERLDTWHQWERLIALAHLGVATRPGHGEGALTPALARLRQRHLGSATDLAQRPAGLVVPVAMHPVDCSSTRIRELLHGAGPGEDAVSRLLAPAVLDYIRQHRLYS